MKVSKYQVIALIMVTLMIGGCTSNRPNTTFDFDFNHPRLRQLAKLKPIELTEIARYKLDKNDETLQSLFRDAVYVAIVVAHDAKQEVAWPGGSTRTQVLPARSLLLFRVYNGKTTLIWESGPHYYISIDVDEYRFSSGKDEALVPRYGFSDRNGNDLPDLAVHLSHGGGNASNNDNVMLIELTSNGGVRDITPRTNLIPSDFIDADDNGLTEIMATRFYDSDFGSEAHAGSPYESRIYEWQGKAYREASVEFMSYFDKKIIDLKKDIRRTYNRPFVSGKVSPLLVQMFFDYEATARSAEGWQEVLSLGDLKNWDLKKTPATEIAKYRRVLNRLRKRVH